MVTAAIPDPALVVLIGPAGSGKSTWAAQRYRAQEVVSADLLRGMVGSGEHDLAASADAFALLDQIVAARLGRGLNTVVDTLGQDAARRRGQLELARRAGLPAVAVLLTVGPAVCRERNRARDLPVPAAALDAQLRRMRAVAGEVGAEGWDLVLRAGLTTGLRLGTLVTPVTFGPPGILAKTVATLDVLSGGRAFCGIGAGWWDREHAAFGLPFPAASGRLDQLELAIETMRALWQPGTRAYHGQRVSLPETTCYPRPAGPVPIIVGGIRGTAHAADRRAAG